MINSNYHLTQYYSAREFKLQSAYDGVSKAAVAAKCTIYCRGINQPASHGHLKRIKLNENCLNKLSLSR